MGYGTVEEGRKQPSGVRNTRVLIIVAALGIVALTCVVTVGLQRAGGRYSLLGEVAVPAGDFTSSADERAYSAYFTQLDASEAKSHQKQEAADSKHQPDTVAQKPRSADAARSDLDSFFDSLSAAKKRLDKGLSSMQAVKNLDDIFPTHEAKDKAKQLAQDHKDAQAAISASKAQADLDGYFDAMGAGLHKKKQIGITREQAAKDVVSMFPSSSAKRAHSKPAAKSAMSAAKAQADLDGYFREMQPETKKHLTHSSATQSTQSDSETHHKWSNQSPEVQDYIAKKRVTIEHNGGFTDVAANGQVVKTSERWSSANARKELDGYFGGDMNKRLQAHHAEHSAKIASHGHSASMNSFIDHHPDFQKQLDMAHRDWMMKHAKPPQTAAEKDEYHKLVLTEDPSKESQYDQSHDIIQEYVKLHPDVAAKFKKLHDTWYGMHKAPPHNVKEQRDYAALMLTIVGKLDINKKEVLAKMAEQKGGPSATAHASKTASGGGKGAVSSLKEHTAADIEQAKRNALADFKRKNPDMAKKIEHVHKIWANTHSGPPHGAAEDKEYDALMQKFVGHPDVSSFMEKKK